MLNIEKQQDGNADCSEKREVKQDKGFTGLLTTKSLANSRQKKKLFLGTCAIVFVAMVSVLIFYGCQKDPDGRVLNGNKHAMGSATAPAERPYSEYEDYFPNESIIEDKLLLINSCVNDTSELLPDMELKEAVWFLEAYFNLGVCRWQEYSPEYVDMQGTYLISIPFASGSTSTEPILNGTVLQKQYRDMLQTIVTTILPEYVINFGDMFVKNIDWASDIVILGMDICYGKPQKDGGEFEATQNEYPCMGTPYGGRLVVPGKDFGVEISSDHGFKMLTYPGAFPDKIYEYKVSKFIDSEIIDEGMTIVLNQKRTEMVPMGIKCPNIWTDNPIYAVNPKYYTNPFIYNTTSTEEFDEDFYNDPNWYNNDGISYGTYYRNHIWDVLCPTGAIPLEAGCKLTHKSDINSSTGKVFHNWGIKRTCSYFIPPCYIEDAHYYIVKAD